MALCAKPPKKERKGIIKMRGSRFTRHQLPKKHEHFLGTVEWTTPPRGDGGKSILKVRNLLNP
jgi:hypothetical protein